jgi:hypothetical protein
LAQRGAAQVEISDWWLRIHGHSPDGVLRLSPLHGRRLQARA